MAVVTLLVYPAFSQTENFLFISSDIQFCGERLIFFMILLVQIAEEFTPFADQIHQALSRAYVFLMASEMFR